jgi:hypothetical protein
LILVRSGVTVAQTQCPRLDDKNGGFIYPHPHYCAFSQSQQKVSIGIPATYAAIVHPFTFSNQQYYGGRVFEVDLSGIDNADFELTLSVVIGDEHDLDDSDYSSSSSFIEKKGLLYVAYNNDIIECPLWTMQRTESYSREERPGSPGPYFYDGQYGGGYTLYLHTTLKLIFGETTIIIWDRIDDEVVDYYHPVDGYPAGYFTGHLYFYRRKEHYPCFVYNGAGQIYYVSFGVFDANIQNPYLAPARYYSGREVTATAHKKEIAITDVSGRAVCQHTAVYWADDAQSDGTSAPYWLRFLPGRLTQLEASIGVQKESAPDKKYGYAKTVGDNTVFAIIDDNELTQIQAYFLANKTDAASITLPGKIKKLSVL